MRNFAPVPGTFYLLTDDLKTFIIFSKLTLLFEHLSFSDRKQFSIFSPYIFRLCLRPPPPQPPLLPKVKSLVHQARTYAPCLFSKPYLGPEVSCWWPVSWSSACVDHRTRTVLTRVNNSYVWTVAVSKYSMDIDLRPFRRLDSIAWVTIVYPQTIGCLARVAPCFMNPWHRQDPSYRLFQVVNLDENNKRLVASKNYLY